MGSNYFAVLQVERRPWIESDQLKQEYQLRTFALHPDRNKTGDSRAVDFAAVTEAYRVLNSPRLRLQHLLSLEGEKPPGGEPAQVTTELSDVFMNAARLAGEIDALLQKREKTNSTLGKSLLQSELANTQARTNTLLQDLETYYADAMTDLRKADAAWTTDRVHALEQIRTLVQRFAFLERWIEQLREKQFQLCL